MKIEVGMHCYNKTNRKLGIGKIISFQSNNNVNVKYKNDIELVSVGNLVASYNIIDLIEEGDLIVIEYYVSKYRERISRIFEVTKDGNKLYFDNCHCRWSYDLLEHKFLQAKGYNPKIKSIVTHEQFESMKYEVE